MSRGELVRPVLSQTFEGADGVTTLPNGIRLRPGQEWWEDTPHRLAVRVSAETRARRIREVARYSLQPGRHGSIVARLRPAPSRHRFVATAVTVGLGIAGGMAAATWWVAVHLEDILTVAGFGAGVVLLLAGLTRFLGGHRPTCAGMHCPGCRR
jgi:hypothetical protein